MERQDLIRDWRENTYSTFADLEIWKRDNQRRLIVVFGWDKIKITHEFEHEALHPVNQTNT